MGRGAQDRQKAPVRAPLLRKQTDLTKLEASPPTSVRPFPGKQTRAKWLRGRRKRTACRTSSSEPSCWGVHSGSAPCFCYRIQSKHPPRLLCTAMEVGEPALWPKENLIGLRTSRTFGQLLKAEKLGCALQTHCSGGITESRSLPYCINHVLYFRHFLML